MAYTMTYTGLLDDVRRYLERGWTEDSDANVYEQLPHLVTLAERRIARMKVSLFIRAVSSALVAGTETYAKPDRWRETVSISVNGSPIQTRSYEFCRAYWPDATETGAPEYYADYDYSHWLIAPTPSEAATMEVLYYEQPDLLGDDNQTNAITEQAPDLLTYAVLLETAPFLKNDERIQTWQGMYESAVKAITGEDTGRILDRNANRSKD